MTKRRTLEMQGKSGAGIIESVGDYHRVKVLNNFEMYVHKNDGSVAPCLVRDGFWESWITLWMIDNIDSNTVFHDIGANSGYYALIAERLGAKVFAYEPNPVYAEMIRATKTLNNLEDSFQVNEVAISNYNGEATLHIPYEMHGSASLNAIDPAYPTKDIVVPARRWDDIYPEGPSAGNHIFKIDAEGEEERILEGAQDFIDKCLPVITLEYTPGAYSDQFLNNLRKSWHINWINYDGVEEPVGDDWISVQKDWRMLVLRSKSSL